MPDRPRVFVTRALPSAGALARLNAVAEVDGWTLERPPTHAELRERARACDGLLTMLTERVDGALLDYCPRVRVVANMAVGYDNIDVPAAQERGVLVTNTPGVLTETTADLAFALLLAVARRLPEGELAVRRGEWGPWHPSWLLGREVHGATLGIVGPGRIGAAVAQRAQGFGMTVLYHGRRRVDGFPGERVSFDSLLERADFVSVHVPLSPETEHMFDARAFAHMRPHAIFVNTSRGGVVDQSALRDALMERRIGGAGLDVTTPEPLSPDDPLLRAPNLLVVPHLGSATEQTRARMAELAVDGLLAGLAGERPQHLVNPAAWERRRT
ncbi:MAG: D-glycerate dehydrogenase [Dehalococcoidia bacterium]